MQDVWNVGFWTHPEPHGQGIMTDSLNAMITFGYQELLAEGIDADHAVWNTASEKVLMNNALKFVEYIAKDF